MSDIMELIVKHAVHWKIGTVEETEALKKEIETRLSAMQEVCDAAILYNNGVMEICEFSNVVEKLEALK
jgi:hypothetical protein